MPEIKNKPDKRGWEIDRLKEMESYIIKISKYKQGLKQKICQDLHKNIRELISCL